MNSPLAKFAHLWREVDDGEFRRVCARLWHDGQILCVKPEWYFSTEDQWQAERLAMKLWGKRDGTR